MIKMICPKCESDEITRICDFVYECEDCGEQFVLEKADWREI